VFALLSTGLALFALYRASRQIETAEEQFERRGWSSDVVLSVVAAVAALVLAAKKSSEMTTKVREVF
jgi:hypothetical protein